MLSDSRTCGAHSFVVDTLKRIETKLDGFIDTVADLRAQKSIVENLSHTVWDEERGNLSDRLGRIERLFSTSKLVVVPMIVSILLAGTYGAMKLFTDIWMHLKR